MADTATKTPTKKSPSKASDAKKVTKAAAKGETASVTSRKSATKKAAAAKKAAGTKKAAATKSTGRRRGPANMSDEHKGALAAGREESRAVREYLDALAMNKPKRGRKRTPESVSARLSAIEEKMSSATPFEMLNLAQERIDLTEELSRFGEAVDLTPLEEHFVQVAGAYAKRKGLTYQAFKQAGVTPQVLKRAGIPRS